MVEDNKDESARKRQKRERRRRETRDWKKRDKNTRRDDWRKRRCAQRRRKVKKRKRERKREKKKRTRKKQKKATEKRKVQDEGGKEKKDKEITKTKEKKEGKKDGPAAHQGTAPTLSLFLTPSLYHLYVPLCSAFVGSRTFLFCERQVCDARGCCRRRLSGMRRPTIPASRRFLPPWDEDDPGTILLPLPLLCLFFMLSFISALICVNACVFYIYYYSFSNGLLIQVERKQLDHG